MTANMKTITVNLAALDAINHAAFKYNTQKYTAGFSSHLGGERITVKTTLADRILKCLASFGPLSKHQLATITGASLATVNTTLCKLRNKKIIRSDNRKYEAEGQRYSLIH